jgi:hypothetical protein
LRSPSTANSFSSWRRHWLLITVEEGAAGGFGAHGWALLGDAGALEHGLGCA